MPNAKTTAESSGLLLSARNKAKGQEECVDGIKLSPNSCVKDYRGIKSVKRGGKNGYFEGCCFLSKKVDESPVAKSKRLGTTLTMVAMFSAKCIC